MTVEEGKQPASAPATEGDLRPIRTALHARRNELVQELLDARSVGEVKRIRGDLEKTMNQLSEVSARSFVVGELFKEARVAESLSLLLRLGLVEGRGDGRFASTPAGVKFVEKYRAGLDQVDLETKILDAVHALGRGVPVPIEAIENQLSGFTGRTVHEAILKLLKEGALFSPQEGYVQVQIIARRDRNSPRR